MKVALIRPVPTLWIDGPPSTAGTILAEIELDMLPAPPAGSSITGDALGAIGEISLERISELSAAEHIFVIPNSVDDDN